jgi:2-polyprenyl-6-methoxyphenol hydroxylase-like FAD-dependent oxidoreductase
MAIQKDIAIIGGGLGGLTLALILHRKGIASAVYELDESPRSRRQGGMLDMHEESAQFALREAGLFEEFQNLILAGGEATRVLDKTAAVLYEDDGTNGGRPEVDRGDLRAMLLRALPEGTVRWNSKVTGVRSSGDGGHEVDFADGTTVSTDILIGADGAWSKVRAAVSSASPEYLGLTFVELHLDDASTRHATALAVAGEGSLFALADEKGLLSHRGTNDSLHIGAALKLPADWSATSEVALAGPESVKAYLENEYADWDQALVALIQQSSGPFKPYPLYALPTGHSWKHTPGVTLLGDAAHLMSPFAGEGANTAMLDAAELALAIASDPEAPDAAIATYEQTMFARAEPAAEQSAAVLELCFAPNAAQNLADLMNSFGRGPE